MRLFGRIPGDIRSLNLFWGPGGEKHQPQPPVAFVEEDMHGTSPKFDVRDSNDKKWKAKLGLEAKAGNGCVAPAVGGRIWRERKLLSSSASGHEHAGDC